MLSLPNKRSNKVGGLDDSFIHSFSLRNYVSLFLLPPTPTLPFLAEYIREFTRRLGEYEAASELKKSQMQQDVKQTLEQQVKQPKNNALGKGEVELEKCGPSSIQVFGGEDHGYHDRTKHQQNQVQDWCSELVAEKERARQEEQRREHEYATYVHQNDQYLERLGEECARKEEARIKTRQLENMELARKASIRREMERQANKEADAAQTQYLQTCQLLTEDKRVATNVTQPHRFRPDHFKGFDREQIRNFYRDNDAVVEEKRDIAVQEANREAEWSRHEQELLRRMDEVEHLKQQRTADRNRALGDALQSQREEFRIRNAKTEVASIGTGFFERFGQSYR